MSAIASGVKNDVSCEATFGKAHYTEIGPHLQWINRAIDLEAKSANDTPTIATNVCADAFIKIHGEGPTSIVLKGDAKSGSVFVIRSAGSTLQNLTQLSSSCAPLFSTDLEYSCQLGPNAALNLTISGDGGAQVMICEPR